MELTLAKLTLSAVTIENIGTWLKHGGLHVATETEGDKHAGLQSDRIVLRDDFSYQYRVSLLMILESESTLCTLLSAAIHRTLKL